MKKLILIFGIILLFISSSSVFASENDKQINSKIEYNYAIEISEWILFGVILSGISIWLWLKKTLWPGKPMWEEKKTIKTYKETTIPIYLVFLTSAIVLGLIVLLPNNYGWLNHISYVNAKIYTAAFFSTMLITGIVKHSVGRKRPDFDERIIKNKNIENGYLSFFSSYSAVSFCNAVFISLFTIEHLNIHPVLKATITLGSIGLATFVSTTRLIDNKSHIEDILLGAFTGSIFSLIFYAVPNNWFGTVYATLNSIGVNINI